jgi:hypothetical protein
MQPDGIWHDAEREPPADNPGDSAVLWVFCNPGDSGCADVGCLARLREIAWPTEKWKLAGVWTVASEGLPIEFRGEPPMPGEHVEFR